MDSRQAYHPLRWRALGLCNGLVRRILTARNSSFTWNVDHADLRYCKDSESTPSLYQSVPYTCYASGNGSARWLRDSAADAGPRLASMCSGSARKLRDYAVDTSVGFASMRERQLFSFHQKQLAVEPIDELTVMKLATFDKDKILQAISVLCGREVVSTNFRTTFIQYLQLCRKAGLQFRVSLSVSSTQCLVCLQHANVPISRFQCQCLPYQFEHIQDCNCECGISFLCMCDDVPPMCYDLDELANIVSATWRQFLDFYVRTCQIFTDEAMSLLLPSDFHGVRVRDVSATIRLSQYEPP